MRFVILILCFVVVTSFKPIGSNTAYLTCRSESGRTLFYAELQDIDGLLEKAELTVDNSKLAFSTDDEVYTIFDPQKGVFTVYMTGKSSAKFPNGRFLQFWALPSTFKILKGSRESQLYEFNARVRATEPRADKELQIPTVELHCRLSYDI